MKSLKGIVIIVICAALCLGYYYYLSHRSPAEELALTELQQVENKDLDRSYPTTPREVVQFYNRILLCLYNQDLEIDDIEVLAGQAQILMDEELLEQNPADMYIFSLRDELEEYEEDGKQILSTTISSSREVEYKTVNGDECAYVDSTYYIKGKKDSGRAKQTYILRKDENGRWKILGYYSP